MIKQRTKMLQHGTPPTPSLAAQTLLQHTAVVLLLMRGVFDSVLPFWESPAAGGGDDGVLVTVLKKTSNGEEAATSRRLALPAPVDGADAGAQGGWYGVYTRVQAVVGQHRGLLHAVMCVILARGWVSRPVAMGLMYVALPVYWVLWNGVVLVPSGGGWQQWLGVVCVCVVVSVLLYDAIRGLM